MIPLKSRRILVFGDSIAWGADDLELGGWVNRLKIWYKSTGKFLEFFDLSDPGCTAKDVLPRLKNEASARIKEENRKRDVIIFSLGLNDSQLGENAKTIPAKDFEKIIVQILESAKSIVEKVVFVGLTPVDESKTSPIYWNENTSYSNQNISKFNQLIKQVCEKNQVFFINVFDKLQKQNFTKYLEDGLHPNPEGHKILYKLIKDFLLTKKII